MSASGRPRRAAPWRKVALGFVGLAVLALAVLVWGWTAAVGYRRVALRHVPAGADLVAWIDVEHRILHQPVSRRLLPVVDAVGRSRGPAPGERLRRLREQAGVNLVRDLREIVLACGPRQGDWVLLLGGKFPAGAVPGVAAALDAEAIAPGWGDLALVAGAAVGQAGDGTLVLASGERVARAALAASSRVALGGESGADLAGLVASGRWLGAAAPGGGAGVPGVERLAGRLTAVGGGLVLALSAGGADGDASRRRAATERIGARIGAWTGRLGWVAPALGTARIETPGPGKVEAVFSLQDADIESGISTIAAALLARWGPPAGPGATAPPPAGAQGRPER